MTVQKLQAKQPKWMVLTMGDGYSRVHSFQDYAIGDNHYIYLYKNKAAPDELPIALYNMGAVLSITIHDEEPSFNYPIEGEKELENYIIEMEEIPKDENEV